MSEPVGNSPRGAIPGNSHRDRKQEPETETREKVEKVIQGKAVVRKQAWYKRAARGMIAEDVGSVGDYVLLEVFVPALKNLIRDIIHGGTDRALYGSVRSRRPGGPGSVLGQVGSLKTKYDNIGPERRSISREARARHDFGEVVLPSYAEAEIVLADLISRVERFRVVSVADLYDAVGVTGSFADQKWGWTDLRDADIRQSRGGFLLDLPAPEQLR